MSNSFDGCVIYTVLQYLVDTEWFYQVLKEINRVLKPGGQLIAIERTCPDKKSKNDELIHRRSTSEILSLLNTSGFIKKKNYIVRRGQFPLTYLIRYGAIPEILFHFVMAIEALLGKIFKKVGLGYAETLFRTEKQDQ